MKQTIKEMQRYKLDTRIRETIYNKYTSIYSGKRERKSHQYGVGILMSPHPQESLIGWDPVNEPIITRMKIDRNYFAVIQCYVESKKRVIVFITP